MLRTSIVRTIWAVCSNQVVPYARRMERREAEHLKAVFGINVRVVRQDPLLTNDEKQRAITELWTRLLEELAGLRAAHEARVEATRGFAERLGTARLRAFDEALATSRSKTGGLSPAFMPPEPPSELHQPLGTDAPASDPTN
jgi:hypothetical protein